MNALVLPLSDEQIVRMREAAKLRVHVSCDEYHGHDATCLSGPEDAIAVCALADEILRERRLLRAIVTSFGTASEKGKS